MVDTRARLLAAVLAAPDDDTPRLVYADWLEENGEGERAEFIRVQIERERLDLSKETARTISWKVLSGLAQFIIEDSFNRTWINLSIEPVGIKIRTPHKIEIELTAGVWVVINFRRGFIDSLSGPLAALLAHGPAIVREHPVTSVTVTDWYEIATYGHYMDNNPAIEWFLRRHSLKLAGLGLASPKDASETINAVALQMLREMATSAPPAA